MLFFNTNFIGEKKWSYVTILIANVFFQFFVFFLCKRFKSYWNVTGNYFFQQFVTVTVQIFKHFTVQTYSLNITTNVIKTCWCLGCCRCWGWRGSRVIMLPSFHGRDRIQVWSGRGDGIVVLIRRGWSIWVDCIQGSGNYSPINSFAFKTFWLKVKAADPYVFGIFSPLKFIVFCN